MDSAFEKCTLFFTRYERNAFHMSQMSDFMQCRVLTGMIVLDNEQQKAVDCIPRVLTVFGS
jgi:hypothetical protein